MPRPPGLPKTGGRKRGSGNKAKAEQVAKAKASGMLPLDFMLCQMRDPLVAIDVRMDAAKASAPYIHPKLSSVEVTGKEGKDLIPEPADPMELARRLAFVLTGAAVKKGE